MLNKSVLPGRIVTLIGAAVLAGGLAEGQVNISANQTGRLTSVGNGATRTFHQYDPQGRVVATQYVQDGQSRTFRTGYGYPQDPAATPGAGNVILDHTFPDGDRVTYTYDLAAQQVTMSSTLAGITEDILRDVKFNARGQLTRLETGNGVVTTFEYAEAGDFELTKAKAVNASGQTIQDYRYSYDANGNVKAIDDYDSSGLRTDLSASCDYDSLDQVIAFRNAAGNVIEAYDYDAIGNLITKGALSQTYGPLRPDGIKRAHALNTSGGITYEYDKNGNVTRIGTTSIEWNGENMATRVVAGAVVTERSFIGESAWKKTDPGGTTYYLPSMTVENGVIRKYYGKYAERLEQSGDRKLRFFHPDHLGSSAVMTDHTGARIRRAAYLPWGQERGAEGYTPKLQFNFKEKDVHGFYDYGARLYNPVTGRWLSPDTLVSDGLNRYAYARNNPWSRIDPTGHDSQWYWIYRFSPLLGTYDFALYPVGLKPPPGWDELKINGGSYMGGIHGSGVGDAPWLAADGRRRLQFQEDGTLLIETGADTGDYQPVSDREIRMLRMNESMAQPLMMQAISEGTYWESPALFMKRDAEYFNAEKKLWMFANTVKHFYGKSPMDTIQEVGADAYNAATEGYKNPNYFSTGITVIGDQPHVESFMRSGRKANRPWAEWTQHEFDVWMLNVLNFRTPVLILNYGRGGESDKRTSRLVEHLRDARWYRYPSAGGTIFSPVPWYTNTGQLLPWRK